MRRADLNQASIKAAHVSSPFELSEETETVMRQLPSSAPITTKCTRTRLSTVVHSLSSLQLTEDPDRVRCLVIPGFVLKLSHPVFSGANLSR
jgi:hypothetical protein